MWSWYSWKILFLKHSKKLIKVSFSESSWLLWKFGQKFEKFLAVCLGNAFSESIFQLYLLLFTWFVGSLHLSVRKTDKGDPRQNRFSIRNIKPDPELPPWPPPGGLNRRLRLRSWTPPPRVWRLYQECSTSWGRKRESHEYSANHSQKRNPPLMGVSELTRLERFQGLSDVYKSGWKDI